MNERAFPQCADEIHKWKAVILSNPGTLVKNADRIGVSTVVAEIVVDSETEFKGQQAQIVSGKESKHRQTNSLLVSQYSKSGRYRRLESLKSPITATTEWMVLGSSAADAINSLKSENVKSRTESSSWQSSRKGRRGRDGQRLRAGISRRKRKLCMVEMMRA